MVCDLLGDKVCLMVCDRLGDDICSKVYDISCDEVLLLSMQNDRPYICFQAGDTTYDEVCIEACDMISDVVYGQVVFKTGDNYSSSYPILPFPDRIVQYLRLIPRPLRRSGKEVYINSLTDPDPQIFRPRHDDVLQRIVSIEVFEPFCITRRVL